MIEAPGSLGGRFALWLRRVALVWLDPAVTACASLALLLWTLPPTVGARPWLIALLHLTMAAITFSVLEVRRRAATRAAAEGFWRDVMAALGIWMLVDAAMAVAEGMSSSGVSASLRVIGALAWAAVWLAASRSPHRMGHWRPRLVERRLHMTGAAAVGIGAASYVVLPPAWAADIEGAARRTWLLLAILSALVIVRLLASILYTASRRWRGVYGALTAAATAAGLGHVSAVVEAPLESSLTLGGPWAAISMTLLTLCARLDQIHADDETAQSLGDPIEEGPQQLETPYLAFAIVLPLIHYGAARMGWLAEELELTRERIMILWMVALASVSVYQQRRLERWSRKTIVERSRLERSLQASRRRLQLMEERRYAEDLMHRSREVYSKAFRNSPWSVSLTTQDGGRHLECNDRYLETIGYPRSVALGTSTVELGIWAETSERERLLKLLEEDGAVRAFEMQYRRSDGELRSALISVVPVDIDGEACLLSVSRDICDLQAIERRRGLVSQLVADLPHPVWHVDLTDRVLALNQAAAAVVGSVTGEPGPSFADLDGLVDPEKWRRAARQTTERGYFSGTLRCRVQGAVRRGTAVMTLVRDYDGLPSGKLIFFAVGS
ncbi:MAG: PAS domain-containing protein [Acidobacteriota bacterium]